MEFHQMYGFLDMATAQKFNQIKERLRERNRYRDEKMEFKEVNRRAARIFMMNI